MAFVPGKLHRFKPVVKQGQQFTCIVHFVHMSFGELINLSFQDWLQITGKNFNKKQTIIIPRNKSASFTIKDFAQHNNIFYYHINLPYSKETAYTFSQIMIPENWLLPIAEEYKVISLAEYKIKKIEREIIFVDG
jgi:hypothetical protein